MLILNMVDIIDNFILIFSYNFHPVDFNVSLNNNFYQVLIVIFAIYYSSFYLKAFKLYELFRIFFYKFLNQVKDFLFYQIFNEMIAPN